MNHPESLSSPQRRAWLGHMLGLLAACSAPSLAFAQEREIGRASCRERV